MNIEEIRKAIKEKNIKHPKNIDSFIVIHKEEDGKHEISLECRGDDSNIAVALAIEMMKNDDLCELILGTAHLYQQKMMEKLAEKMGEAGRTL